MVDPAIARIWSIWSAMSETVRAARDWPCPMRQAPPHHLRPAGAVARAAGGGEAELPRVDKANPVPLAHRSRHGRPYRPYPQQSPGSTISASAAITTGWIQARRGWRMRGYPALFAELARRAIPQADLEKVASRNMLRGPQTGRGLCRRASRRPADRIPGEGNHALRSTSPAQPKATENQMIAKATSITSSMLKKST